MFAALRQTILTVLREVEPASVFGRPQRDTEIRAKTIRKKKEVFAKRATAGERGRGGGESFQTEPGQEC